MDCQGSPLIEVWMRNKSRIPGTSFLGHNVVYFYILLDSLFQYFAKIFVFKREIDLHFSLLV